MKLRQPLNAIKCVNRLGNILTFERGIPLLSFFFSFFFSFSFSFFLSFFFSFFLSFFLSFFFFLLTELLVFLKKSNYVLGVGSTASERRKWKRAKARVRASGTAKSTK
jgi:hypothetical protein